MGRPDLYADDTSGRPRGIEVSAVVLESALKVEWRDNWTSDTSEWRSVRAYNTTALRRADTSNVKSTLLGGRAFLGHVGVSNTTDVTFVSFDRRVVKVNGNNTCFDDSWLLGRRLDLDLLGRLALLIVGAVALLGVRLARL